MSNTVNYSEFIDSPSNDELKSKVATVPEYVRIPNLSTLPDFFTRIQNVVDNLDNSISNPEENDINRTRMTEQRDFIVHALYDFRGIISEVGLEGEAYTLNPELVRDINPLYHLYVKFHNHLKTFNAEELDNGGKSGLLFLKSSMTGVGISHLYG